MALAMAGALGRIADERVGEVVEACAGSRRPSGCGTPTSAKSRRQPVFEPSSARRGSAPYIGMPRLEAMSRSSSVVL